jgi:hypothetical protein
VCREFFKIDFEKRAFENRIPKEEKKSEKLQTHLLPGTFFRPRPDYLRLFSNQNFLPFKFPNNLIPVSLPAHTAYEDVTVCSETLVHKPQTPGNHPKEITHVQAYQHSRKSVRSIVLNHFMYCLNF